MVTMLPLSDPDRATMNVFRRDMLLAQRVTSQAQERGLTVHEVDELRSVEQVPTSPPRGCC